MPCSRSSALLIAAVACAACSKPGASSTAGNPVIEAATFADALGVDLKASMKSASGLYYRDLVIGTGAEAKPGLQVSVKYAGTLADGTKFDAGTFPFVLGAHAVEEVHNYHNFAGSEKHGAERWCWSRDVSHRGEGKVHENQRPSSADGRTRQAGSDDEVGA